MARSRRLGAEVWIYRSMSDSVGNLIFHGEFDRAAALLDELGELDLPELETVSARFNRLQLEILRGGSPQLLGETMEAASAFEGSPDRQIQSFSALFKAIARILQGRYEDAFDEVVDDGSPYALVITVFTALAAKDPVRVGRAIQSVNEHGLRGRLTDALQSISAAGDRALRGEKEPAAFVEALDLLDRVVYPLDMAAFRSAASMLLGSDHPEGRRIGVEALDWIRQTGAIYLEELWGDWLPIERASSETA